ncbi:MAG: peptidylprolyl isomerase [Thermodesulfobacteriota bacterium]
MRLPNKSPLSLAILAVFFLLLTPLAKAELVDRVVAIVNDDVITFSDLNREGAPVFRRIMQQAPPEQMERALLQAREELLSTLIDKLIVEQRAKKLGISVSDADVNNALSRLIARNNTTPEAFWKQLTSLGATEQSYRGMLKSQLLHDKLVEYEIRSRVAINDERIREYYEKHYAQQISGDAYHILQMGFSWKEDTPAGRGEARQRAETVHKLAESGQDFRALAKQHSNLPSAADGGDIGAFQKDELAAPMKAAILGLKPGQISKIQETADGFQFFKLLSDRGDVRYQVPFESVREEIRKKLFEEALGSQFKKWVKELRDEAYIKIML